MFSVFILYNLGIVFVRFGLIYFYLKNEIYGSGL
jgi:hypothetical protein